MSLDEQQRAVLLGIARRSIDTGIDGGHPTALPDGDYAEALMKPRGNFVTLRSGPELRGCCGSVWPKRLLAEDVWRNAYASGWHDPRFPVLLRKDVAGINIEISVLSEPERLAATAEEQLLQVLRPGTDGLLLETDDRRVTYLPAVWQQLPAAVDFLLHLKRKAGWQDDYWSSSIRCYRYEVESFAASAVSS